MSLRLPYRPAIHSTSRGLYSSHSCPVRPAASSHPVFHRPQLLQKEVRCRKDSGSLLRQAEGRDGFGGPERRSGRRGKRDDAASPRLAVVTSRSAEGRIVTVSHRKSGRIESNTLANFSHEDLATFGTIVRLTP